MKIDILTLFPEMFEGPFSESIIKRAQEKELVEISIHNLRAWAEDKHNTVDGRPYGGGPGMVLRVDIIDSAVSSLQSPNSSQNTGNHTLNTKVILLSAKGKAYNQQKAQELSKFGHLILIAGHYEGVDHRVHEHIADDVISVGDYVLTGGEIPAMVVADSVVRLIPGVIDPESLKDESFSLTTNYQLPATNIEHPHYTRPEKYKGWEVPEVLLSGNHAEIEKWRNENSKRPEGEN